MTASPHLPRPCRGPVRRLPRRSPLSPSPPRRTNVAPPLRGGVGLGRVLTAQQAVDHGDAPMHQHQNDSTTRFADRLIEIAPAIHSLGVDGACVVAELREEERRPGRAARRRLICRDPADAHRQLGRILGRMSERRACRALRHLDATLGRGPEGPGRGDARRTPEDRTGGIARRPRTGAGAAPPAGREAARGAQVRPPGSLRSTGPGPAGVSPPGSGVREQGRCDRVSAPFASETAGSHEPGPPCPTCAPV